MKKYLYLALAIVIGTITYTSVSVAQSPFPTALKTCETYKQQGSVTHNSAFYVIDVSLSKHNDKCIYKEKISQGPTWDLLKCEFSMNEMSAIADSMQRFNDYYKSEIAKNPIFGAKMTTNGEVFNAYLANPAYCNITQSKKK